MMTTMMMILVVMVRCTVVDPSHQLCGIEFERKLFVQYELQYCTFLYLNEVVYQETCSGERISY